VNHHLFGKSRHFDESLRLVEVGDLSRNLIGTRLMPASTTDARIEREIFWQTGPSVTPWGCSV
jgi:hypothetical protein